MKNKLLITLFFSFKLITATYAQQADKERIIEIFAKTQKIYEDTKTYCLENEYKMYVNETSNEIKEKYTGILLKKGDETYSKIATTEFINSGGISIKIDNENKRIKIVKNKKADNAQSKIDLGTYLKYYTKYKLKEKDNLWICELSTSNISMIPYKKVVVYIKKNDSQLVKQEMFFLSKYKTKLVNGVAQYNFPRLEITYKKFIKSGFDTSKYLTISNYVTLNNGKYLPVKTYKSYTIVD